MCTHYCVYGIDGIGLPGNKLLGRILESAADITLVLLLILLAMDPVMRLKPPSTPKSSAKPLSKRETSDLFQAKSYLVKEVNNKTMPSSDGKDINANIFSVKNKSCLNLDLSEQDSFSDHLFPTSHHMKNSLSKRKIKEEKSSQPLISESVISSDPVLKVKSPLTLKTASDSSKPIQNKKFTDHLPIYSCFKTSNEAKSSSDPECKKAKARLSPEFCDYMSPNDVLYGCPDPVSSDLESPNLTNIPGNEHSVTPSISFDSGSEPPSYTSTPSKGFSSESGSQHSEQSVPTSVEKSVGDSPNSTLGFQEEGPLTAKGGENLPRPGDFLTSQEIFILLKESELPKIKEIPVGVKENKYFLFNN